MKGRVLSRVLGSGGVLLAVVVLASVSARGHDQLALTNGAVSPKHAGRERYVVPRTPWGDPDLEGYWPGTAMAGVPVQRDPKFGTRNILTEEEFKQRQKQYRKQQQLDLADFHLEEASRFETAGAAGGPLSSPPHWFERGEPNHHASLIVDPLNGRMPPLTEHARKRNAAMRDLRNSRGPTDSFADRNLYDRCITRGVVGSVLPVIYNNGNHIVQGPGYVAIHNEMIHETRVIPLDGRPHVGSHLRMWMGDSRGHWDADTLVVDTRNMTDGTAIGGNGMGQLHSRALKLTERLTRLDAETILYEVTVDDPLTWTRPWTMRFPWKRNDTYGFYEYACHEGNYAMFNMLRAARADEKTAADAAAKEHQR